jgi:hypothetical protein
MQFLHDLLSYFLWTHMISCHVCMDCEAPIQFQHCLLIHLSIGGECDFLSHFTKITICLEIEVCSDWVVAIWNRTHSDVEIAIHPTVRFVIVHKELACISYISIAQFVTWEWLRSSRFRQNFTSCSVWGQAWFQVTQASLILFDLMSHMILCHNSPIMLISSQLWSQSFCSRTISCHARFGVTHNLMSYVTRSCGSPSVRQNFAWVVVMLCTQNIFLYFSFSHC